MGGAALAGHLALCIFLSLALAWSRSDHGSTLAFGLVGISSPPGSWPFQVGAEPNRSIPPNRPSKHSRRMSNGPKHRS